MRSTVPRGVKNASTVVQRAIRLGTVRRETLLGSEVRILSERHVRDGQDGTALRTVKQTGRFGVEPDPGVSSMSDFSPTRGGSCADLAR